MRSPGRNGGPRPMRQVKDYSDLGHPEGNPAAVAAGLDFGPEHNIWSLGRVV